MFSNTFGKRSTENKFTQTPGTTEPVIQAAETAPKAAPKMAHVIVLGNEKGGSGKTTSCMHLIISLLRLGFTVASIDVDARQKSLTRYLDNRKNTIQKKGYNLPSPTHIVIPKSAFPVQKEAEMDEAERFLRSLLKLQEHHDFVVIDSPGNDTFLSRLGHSCADTIITPINDSFVDLDVLANVDADTGKVIKPSIYSEMVWEQKLNRAKRDGGSVDWIVMRNRLSSIAAKNKFMMVDALSELSRRVGFRTAPGFSERVIFRELFLQGLTVLDLMDTGTDLTMSHIAARQEIRELLKMLKIKAVDERLEQTVAREAREVEEKKRLKKEQAEAQRAAKKAAAQPAGKPAEKTASPSPVYKVAPAVEPA